MDQIKDEKEATEVLRSLLSMPRIQNQQVSDVNYWQNNTNYQVSQEGHHEQILWSIQSGNMAPVASDNDIEEEIPLTYISSDQRPIYTTEERPVTYVFSHIPDNYDKTINLNNHVVIQEPVEQKVVLIDNSGIILNERKHNDYVIIDNSVNYDQQRDDSVVELQVVNVNNENSASKDGKPKLIDEIKRENENSDKRNEDQDFELTDSSESADDEPLSIKKDKYKIQNQKTKSRKKKPFKPNTKQKLKKSQKIVKRVYKDLKCKGNQKNNGEGGVQKDKEEEKKKNEGVKVKPSHNELTELEDNSEQVSKRFAVGCECAENNCFDGLNAEKVFKHRLNIADLTKAEHDMYLMGVIMASMQNPEETCRHKERIRIRSSYVYQGKKVCLTAFLYLEHVTLYQMKRLRKHLRCHGVSPRIHGNHGRKPANTLSLDIYRQATEFVKGYIQQHSFKHVQNLSHASKQKNGKIKKIKVPNRMTLYHLPPECTKKTVHNDYRQYCEKLSPHLKTMKYSTFTSFLKKQFPNVKFHKVEKKDVVQSLETEKQEDRSKNKKGLKVSGPQLVLRHNCDESSPIVLTGSSLQVCNSNQLIIHNSLPTLHPYTQHTLYTMHNA